MCQICRHSPCLNGCPNAPDPPAVTTCRKCGEPITPGYEFARIDGLDYCDECIDDMPYCELVPLLGGKWEHVPAGRIVSAEPWMDASTARTVLTRFHTASW